MKIPQSIKASLFSTSSVKALEQQYVVVKNIPLYDLMERAGFAAFELIKKHWPKAMNITIVCGAGNNAGDGLVLARIAHQAGLNVTVLMIKDESGFQGDSQVALMNLKHLADVVGVFDPKKLMNQDLIVDAILGTGFTGELKNEFKVAVESVNHCSAKSDIPVLSLDIPTGLNAQTGYCPDTAIIADRTICFVALKAGLFTANARAYCGEVELSSLGTEPEQCKLDEEIYPVAWIDDADALIHRLPKRSKISHKGDHGHLLLIGGDYGFGGAILMSAMAAARSGVGLITVLTRDVHVAPLLTQCPEAMIRAITGADDPSLAAILSSVDAVVIGPGLGQKQWGRELVAGVIEANLPLLVDADALNIISTSKLQYDQWVMTPHPGEAARLLNCSVDQIERDRYAAVVELQHQYSGVQVLKGPGTLITDKNNRITVCNEGNAGMASAGMGDILSGIIGSLLAQGLTTITAARTGVALHSRAADLAAQHGQKGLMATDLIQPLRALVNAHS